jgi:broad specificity phosphatase PhoE
LADPADPITLARLPLPEDLVATLVLVRHGESTWVAEGRFQGRQDVPLSELGARQAALVADRLARRDDRTPLPIPTGTPVQIWHSPLRRAAETARIIAERQPSAILLEPSDRLTEIAQGDWEGVLLPDVQARWPNELASWRQTPARAHAPGGESLVDAAERVRAALADIAAALPAMTLPTAYDPVPGYSSGVLAADSPTEPWALLVAHDGIFRLTLINLLGLPLERFWSFPFILAGVTVVTLHRGAASLRAHNLSDHLAPLAEEDRAAQESRGERRGAL